MDTLAFMIDNLASIIRLTVEHIEIVGVGVGFAILTGVPLGIAITANERAARVVLYLAAILMTIPSVALFGLDDSGPVVDRAGHRLSRRRSSRSSFIRNCRSCATRTRRSPTSIRRCSEAARGIGMTTRQRLWKVEIPIALPIIMAGVRMAVVINVGIAAVAAYIGAGGLGKLDQPRHLAVGPASADCRRDSRERSRDRRRLWPRLGAAPVDAEGPSQPVAYRRACTASRRVGVVP